jgi:MoaA/NifB/PqqE/SkfB family radical SAM enzyme
MCGSSISRKNENELNLAEIKKIADVLDRLNIGVILLTGGEPFLRPDLPEIIRIFSKKGFTVRLQTNGILASEEMIKSACQAGMREVTLSLNSLEPDRQDALTGQKGSWHKIIEAIANFSRILPARGTLLGINTVVYQQNLKELPNIVKFVTACGFYSSLIPVHVTNQDNNDFIIRKSDPGLLFSEKDFDEIDLTYKKVIDMKKNGYHIYNSYKFLRESPTFLKGKRINWNCDSPYLYFSISSSGKFLPCVDIKTNISILDHGFYALYNSEKFKAQIEEMVKKCPGCFYACYPEMTYFCRDLKTTLDRLWEGGKVMKAVRKPINYADLIRLIEKIRNDEYRLN